MKILVIGGMHGNEPLGLNVVRMFRDNPVANIDTIIANEEAVSSNTRFITQDLNRSFPGNAADESYESRRAAELLKMSKRYDIVLDFHNTQCPDNDCGFIGEGATQVIYEASWLLGLERVIVADYECINKYATNCLSVEVSLSSLLCRPEIWYERISLLSKLGSLSVQPKLEQFRFVYRLTLEDRDRYDLSSKDLKAFVALDDALAENLGLAGPVYPIFIGDGYTPYNFGGLVKKTTRQG